MKTLLILAGVALLAAAIVVHGSPWSASVEAIAATGQLSDDIAVYGASRAASTVTSWLPTGLAIAGVICILGGALRRDRVTKPS